jgi:hypothetical protein
VLQEQRREGEEDRARVPNVVEEGPEQDGHFEHPGCVEGDDEVRCVVGVHHRYRRQEQAGDPDRWDDPRGRQGPEIDPSTVKGRDRPYPRHDEEGREDDAHDLDAHPDRETPLRGMRAEDAAVKERREQRSEYSLHTPKPLYRAKLRTTPETHPEAQRRTWHRRAGSDRLRL